MNHSYFHKVNNGLTLNLADIQFAEDRTAHYSGHLDIPSCAKLIAENRPFCVGMREGMDVLGGHYGGQQFNITAEEFRALQDAMTWYSSHVTAEDGARQRKAIVEDTAWGYFTNALQAALDDGWRVTPGTFQEIVMIPADKSRKGKDEKSYFVALER